MSFNINTLAIDGNLTRDPELRMTPSGTSVCKLRIAHSARVKRNGEWTDAPYYFDVTVWSGVGEWIANNASKGDRVVVQGRLQWREWEAEGGGKRQAVDIVADGIILQRRDGDGGGGGQRFTPESDVPADTSDFAPAPSGGVDDDIPF